MRIGVYWQLMHLEQIVLWFRKMFLLFFSISYTSSLLSLTLSFLSTAELLACLQKSGCTYAMVFSQCANDNGVL